MVTEEVVVVGGGDEGGAEVGVEGKGCWWGL